MDDDRRKKAEKLLQEVLGEPAPASTWHRLRADVLELATTTEHRIDEILAAGTARTVAHGEGVSAQRCNWPRHAELAGLAGKDR